MKKGRTGECLVQLKVNAAARLKQNKGRPIFVAPVFEYTDRIVVNFVEINTLCIQVFLFLQFLYAHLEYTALRVCVSCHGRSINITAVGLNV